jgi:hypothetical protein
MRQRYSYVPGVNLWPKCTIDLRPKCTTHGRGAEANVLDRHAAIRRSMRRVAPPPFGGSCGSCTSCSPLRRSWARLIGQQVRQEIRHGHRFVAVRTGPAGTDSPAEHVAVGTALLAQVPRATGRAFVHCDRPGGTAGNGREHDGLAPTPGGLPARRGTVASPATERRWSSADGAVPPGYRYATVTRRGFTPVCVGLRNAIRWSGVHPVAPVAPVAPLVPGAPVGGALEGAAGPPAVVAGVARR